MNELEINKAVAEKLGGKVWFRYAAGSNIWSVTFDSVPGKVDLPDYCNNWQAAGPIIEKYKIDLTWCDDEGVESWVANHGEIYKPKFDESALKAAMLCFLEMEI